MSSFELKKSYKEVLKCENNLALALQQLSSVASEIYGKKIEASICVDGEIEFRLYGEDYIEETTIEELMQKAERGDSNIYENNHDI